MWPVHYQNYKFLHLLKRRRLWLFFLLGIALVSCKKKASTGPDDYSDDFKTVFNKTNKFNDRKEFAQGIHYLDSAFAEIKHPTINDRFRYYSLNFMYDKKTIHNSRLEIIYADSMLAVAAKSDNDKQYVANFAEANFAKGDGYFDAKQYNEAYRCFYQGYFVGKNHLNNIILSEYTYRMGMIMFRQSHFKLAAGYFKESYKQGFSNRDDFRAFYQRQEVLNDIGESYEHSGDIDSATTYFNKAIAFINKNDGKFKVSANMLDVARAVTYGDQGYLLMQKNQYPQAKEMLKKSIAINLKKYNDNSNAELVEINLAQLYFDNKEYTPFMSLLHDLRQQLDSIKNLEAETDWNRLMSTYYTRNNDFASAFQYFKSYSVLKDSLIATSNSIKETNVNQQLANYEKQYQIENLQDDNKLQLIYLYLAIAGVVMAVIIIFLVYRNWKISKSDILVVSALNRKISSQKIDLETTLEELKLSSQEKDRILRTVAHDLRNPIGGIVSLTNVMLDDEYTEEQKDLILLLKRTSQNSLELINEILEATNLTGGALNREMIEINSLVSNSVELLGFKAAEKDQKIITELLANPKEVLISQEKIWRVISNLISNAIKFSPTNSAIKVKISCDKNDVTIAVKDNGIGIPDNIKDQVFNIFTDAKRPGTAGEKSFGLGLSICQQIIESHHGKIWFESTTKGTNFYISLPLNKNPTLFYKTGIPTS
jgi:two-component system sensor histidine kinase VicK